MRNPRTPPLARRRPRSSSTTLPRLLRLERPQLRNSCPLLAALMQQLQRHRAGLRGCGRPACGSSSGDSGLGLDDSAAVSSLLAQLCPVKSESRAKSWVRNGCACKPPRPRNAHGPSAGACPSCIGAHPVMASRLTDSWRHWSARQASQPSGHLPRPPSRLFHTPPVLLTTHDTRPPQMNHQLLLCERQVRGRGH